MGSFVARWLAAAGVLVDRLKDLVKNGHEESAGIGTRLQVFDQMALGRVVVGLVVVLFVGETVVAGIPMPNASFGVDECHVVLFIS